MPDAKITALTAISVIDVAADMLPIVDISDTSMAASGTTKKITINQILGASGTATFSALTVSGAATAQRFIPSSATVPTNGLYLPAANELGWAINSAEAMRLNSTGLGVGVSPSFNIHARGTTDGRIQVEGASGYGMVFIQASSGNSAQLQLNSNGGSGRRYVVASNSSGQFLIGDETAVATRLTIDSSGNVGIGVGTFGTSAAKVLSIGTGTEPTTGPAGSVQFFTSTRSASNTIPAIFTEGSGVTNAAITNTTVTNKIAIKVNGTIYYLLATTSAA